MAKAIWGYKAIWGIFLLARTHTLKSRHFKVKAKLRNNTGPMIATISSNLKPKYYLSKERSTTTNPEKQIVSKLGSVTMATQPTPEQETHQMQRRQEEENDTEQGSKERDGGMNG